MSTSNTTITPAAAALELLSALETRSQNEHTADASTPVPAAPAAAPVVPAAKGTELNSSPCQTPEVKSFRFGEMYVRMIMSKDKQPLFCLKDIVKGCALKNINNTIKQIKEQFTWGSQCDDHPAATEMGNVKHHSSPESDKQAAEMGGVKVPPSQESDTAEMGDVKHHSSSEVQLTQMYLPDALGRMQMSTMVTEAQMYFVIMRGRSAASKRFCNWICSEVIPSIRRTGSYSIRVHVPEMNEEGKYAVAYTAFANEFCNKVGLQGEERAAFFWCIERAKQQGIAIGINVGEGKEKQRHANEASYEAGLIEADNKKMLQLQQDVEFYKAEAVRFQKLDALKGGALSVLVQYPNDGVVRMLAKQILGFEEQN